MTSLFPGAVWRPMPGQEQRPLRRKGRGVGYHVAVYTGPSIYDINLRTGNDAHLYVRLDGGVEQNVDLDRQAWAGADGNGSMIWVETAGGLGTSAQLNAEQWNPAQAATLARIARWAHDTEGVPLQLMPDSKPASRGVGPHRLGIQHSAGIGKVAGWLVAGGERWSSVLGKECPGNAKIAQLPQIIASAASGAPIVEEDDMTPDQEALLRLTLQTAQQAKDLAQSVVDGLYRGGPATGGTPLADQIQNLARPQVSGAVNVAGGTVDLDAFADKVADKLASRLAS